MALSKGQLTRQKMINLMYLVFIAMLALNISTEVLDGFVLINDNLQESIRVADERNRRIYQEIEDAYNSNPEKAKVWYDIANDVKYKTDSIYNLIQLLKEEIAKQTDGSDADPNNLRKMDYLDASSEVMMAPMTGQGKKLEKALNYYRESVLPLISDSVKRNVVQNTLSTEPSERAKKNRKTWLQASFERMPSIAAVTLLSELQVNVKQAEAEVLNSLALNIDIKDLRVNELSAFVVPQSNMVMRGTTYKANIIMAAVDTTQRPRIVIDGKELPDEKNGIYEFIASGSGPRSFSGFIEMLDRQGNPLVRDFTQKYTVMEPMATIAPLLMDVVYSGIDNKISISVPGVATNDVSARSTAGGTLTPEGNGIWVARPTGVGGKFTIAVSANVNGVTQQVALKDFRIRALPDPTPYIEYRDNDNNLKRHKRGSLARSILLNTDELKASIDDGILNIPFTVVSFQTISFDAMNNFSPELSNGSRFSEKQKDQIRRLSRGTEIYIAKIRVRGPDGERDLNAMNIRIN